MSFDPEVRWYRSNFEFWLRVIKRRARKCYPRDPFGCIKAVGRMCVCSGGTSSVSTAVKEAVFCNFDFMYHPFCLHPPDMPCYEGASLEGTLFWELCKVNGEFSLCLIKRKGEGAAPLLPKLASSWRWNVKFTPEQTMKAQRGRRGIALLFH